MQSREEESSTLDDDDDDDEDWVHWNDVQPKTLEHIQAMLQRAKKAASLASNRERTSLAYAFSNTNQVLDLSSYVYEINL